MAVAGAWGMEERPLAGDRCLLAEANGGGWCSGVSGTATASGGQKYKQALRHREALAHRGAAAALEPEPSLASSAEPLRVVGRSSPALDLDTGSMADLFSSETREGHADQRPPVARKVPVGYATNSVLELSPPGCSLFNDARLDDFLTRQTSPDYGSRQQPAHDDRPAATLSVRSADRAAPSRASSRDHLADLTQFEDDLDYTLDQNLMQDLQAIMVGMETELIKAASGDFPARAMDLPSSALGTACDNIAPEWDSEDERLMQDILADDS